MRSPIALFLLLTICLQPCLSNLGLHSPDVLLKTSNGNGALVFKLNKAIDFLLTVARWMFTKHGHLTLSLPKINSEFGSSFMRGNFSADGGYFNNIGSLHRTGDIDFIKVNSSLSLEVALGLTEIEAGYKNYSLNMLTIKQGGDMHASVDKNSVKMKMTFHYSPKCQFELEVLEFDALSGIKVDITGLGAFQIVYDQLSKWLISNFEDRFRIIANKKMHSRLREVVQKQSDLICRWWPEF